HQPDHARHGARDADLLRAHERHVVKADLTGRERGELRGEVVGHGEQDADHGVRRELVTAHHRGHQLRGPLQDLLPPVPVELDRPAYSPDCHVCHPSKFRRPQGTAGCWPHSPTAAYSSPISFVVRSRVVPGRRLPSRTGPTSVRTSRLTGWPASASIRRTMCLRPSCKVISTWARAPDWAISRNLSATAIPSSSSTPRASVCPSDFGTGPGTSAM